MQAVQLTTSAEEEGLVAKAEGSISHWGYCVIALLYFNVSSYVLGATRATKYFSLRCPVKIQNSPAISDFKKVEH